VSLTAALARSELHLGFLVANGEAPDYVLYRESRLEAEVERLYPGKGLYLGREGRLPLRPGAALAQFRANHAYYRQVRATLEPLGVDRLIVFLEGEPLERSIFAWFEGAVELWEDGLSHYVDLTSSLWYAARGAIQVASGFYPHGAMRRRADRSRWTVRDRFEKHNLVLPALALAPPAEAMLVIGSPLVEDGIIGRQRLVDGLQCVAGASPWPVRYLPHPREDQAALDAMLAQMPQVELAALPHGIAPHVAAHGYRAYVAPASTALLDLHAFERSAFVPLLFGLGKMHRALSTWRANPVCTLSQPSGLAAFLAIR
jgi:hypothetical protein